MLELKEEEDRGRKRSSKRERYLLDTVNDFK
jgi:hypothetical protein